MYFQHFFYNQHIYYIFIHQTVEVLSESLEVISSIFFIWFTVENAPVFLFLSSVGFKEIYVHLYIF